MHHLALQNRMPISPRRRLSPDEQARVEDNLGNWISKINPGYSTPPEELLSSPGKGALLHGLLGALAGGGLGAAAGAGLQNQAAMAGGQSPIGALGGAGIGALLGGVPAALMGYFGRRSSNEDVIDLMSRGAPGASYRDLLADPLYGGGQSWSPNRDDERPSAWDPLVAVARAAGRMQKDAAAGQHLRRWLATRPIANTL